MSFDPEQTSSPYSVVLNRMSPSSWLRGTDAGLFRNPEVPLLPRKNRSAGDQRERGILIRDLEGSPDRPPCSTRHKHPRARAISRTAEAVEAADGLVFPVLVKPNVGGSGAGIEAFESPAELAAAVKADTLDFGPDHTALVQEYLPAQDDAIVRVELLDGEFLYAIRLLLVPGSFNLCPADYCDIPGVEDTAPGRGLAVQNYVPPPEIVRDAQRILAATGATVGGVEYLVNARDGHPYFYDINVLSNFVTDAPDVVGFDPFVNLVDHVVEVAGIRSMSGSARRQ